MPQMKMTSRLATIQAIGEQMVACTQNCEGASTAAQGTPPRCLYLEEDPATEDGVIVVGLNPGKARKIEINFYQQKGLTYTATCEFLKQNMRSIKYYARVGKFVKRNWPGRSILWTEIAKCELQSRFKKVSLDMKRNCTKTYLSRELSTFPEWPVVAIGRIAFEATALLAADRAVIGVPHPTGAWGNFFDKATGKKGSGLSKRRRAALDAALDQKKALWLGDAKA